LNLFFFWRIGILGTFPALNTRSDDILDDWLKEITTALGPNEKSSPFAPYGVNLIVHKTNQRLEKNLEKVIKYKVPLVISSLGANKNVIDAVHGYGGLIFHDVTNPIHAKKAADV